MARLTKEERHRNQRRRTRQIIGAAMTVLMVIGCISIVRSSVDLVGEIFDDTEQKIEFEEKLSGLVRFDPLPFDQVANMQDTTLREAAVWGTVYQILATETGFENYDRHPETDQVLLPSIEVDAYLATIFGPDFKFVHKTFEMDGMTLYFDETAQRYYIPVTSSVGRYTPVVDSLTKKSGQLIATVGYIPIPDVNMVVVNAEQAKPTKYMDYLFDRVKGNWYLVAVQDSEKKAEAPSSTAVTSTTVPPLEDFEATILEDIEKNEAESKAALEEAPVEGQEAVPSEGETSQDETA